MAQIATGFSVTCQLVLLAGVFFWCKGFVDGSPVAALTGQGIFLFGASGLIFKVVYGRIEKGLGKKVVNGILICLASFFLIAGVLCFVAPGMVNFIPVADQTGLPKK